MPMGCSSQQRFVLVELHEPEDGAHRRRLAGAVRPKEAEHVSALDRE